MGWVELFDPKEYIFVQRRHNKFDDVDTLYS